MALAEPAATAAAAPEALARARERARPVTLAGERSLPVDDALAGLLPGGLRRGSAVAVDGGAGATTLTLALAVAASAAGSWVGTVGARSLGLLAALELGVAPERLVVVADPPASSWSTIAAALIDTVDIVVLGVPRIAAGDARRLRARAHERGAVLVALSVAGRSPWPERADVQLTVTSSSWTGPAGGGAGRLLARRAEVTGGGRAALARPRRATLWLPGPDGRVSLCRSGDESSVKTQRIRRQLRGVSS